MFMIFHSEEQPNKEKGNCSARGAGLLKRGWRKSDTQELDYEEIAARQAEMKAAAEEAAAREEAETPAATAILEAKIPTVAALAEVTIAANNMRLTPLAVILAADSRVEDEANHIFYCDGRPEIRDCTRDFSRL